MSLNGSIRGESGLHNQDAPEPEQPEFAPAVPMPPTNIASATADLQPRHWRRKPRQSSFSGDPENEESDDWSDSSAEESESGDQGGSPMLTADVSSGRAQPTRRHRRHGEWPKAAVEYQRDAAKGVRAPDGHSRSFGEAAPPTAYGYPPQPLVGLHTRQNSFPSAGFYVPHPPPPPSRHRSNPFPASAPAHAFGPGIHPGPAMGANAYGGYGVVQPGNPALGHFPRPHYPTSQDPYSMSYPENQYSKATFLGYYPPGANNYPPAYGQPPVQQRAPQPHGAEEMKMHKEVDSPRREQYASRVEPVEDRERSERGERSERKFQEDDDRREKRGREDARRKDLERLVKQQVKAEVRKRMQRKSDSAETPPSTPSERRRQEPEGRSPLESGPRAKQADDNQSLSSFGSSSRKDMDTESLLLEIKDLIEEKVKAGMGRRTSEASASSWNSSSRKGLEVATRESGELVCRSEVQDIILDALRNFRVGDSPEAASIPPLDGKATGLSPSSYDETTRLHQASTVPHLPDSGQFNPGVNGGPPQAGLYDGSEGGRAESSWPPHSASRGAFPIPPPGGDHYRSPPRSNQPRQLSIPPMRDLVRRPRSPSSGAVSSDEGYSDHSLLPPNPPPRVPNPPVQTPDDLDQGSHAGHTANRHRDRRRQAPPAQTPNQRRTREADLDSNSQGRRRAHRPRHEPDINDSSDEDQYSLDPRSMPRAYSKKSAAARPPLAPDPPPATAQPTEFAMDWETRRPRRRRQSEAYNSPYEHYDENVNDFQRGPQFVPNPMAPRRRY